jgi:single-stranded-DNA-specific exonuclease
LALLDDELFQSMRKLSPFGMANPEPVFVSRGVRIDNVRILGKEAQHLKLALSQDGKAFDAIAFGMGSLAESIKTGDKIDVAYVLDENIWNGKRTLQLKVRDIHTK